MKSHSGLTILGNSTQPAAGLLAQDILSQIQLRLRASELSLRDAIRQRDLYFRVSVVGTCNLSCQFCHNEGAPVQGQLSLEVAERATAAAARVGFDRVQFTGGEPLLRKDIADFVRMARQYVDDVGITTNGTFLPQRLDSLIAARITRMHVSLQEESLVEAGSGGAWGIPDWLEPTVKQAERGAFILRLNLPVPANCLGVAEEFLRLFGCHVKVFSVLPEGQFRGDEYPLAELEALVERVNAERKANRVKGEVLLRGYRPPEGIRCPTCNDRPRCKEQSHSLRLGSDLILRPCLATRDWDSPLRQDDVDESIREAALLALDYSWS